MFFLFSHGPATGTADRGSECSSADENEGQVKVKVKVKASFDVPESWLFSTSELIEANKVPLKGKRITVHVSTPGDLERTVKRSDAADVYIPALEIENLSGKGRFTSIGNLLLEIRVTINALLRL